MTSYTFSEFAAASYFSFDTVWLIATCLTQNWICPSKQQLTMIKFVFVKNCLSLKPLNYTLNYYDVDLSLKQSYYACPLVLWRCWLGVRKSIRPVKSDKALVWLSVWSEVQVVCIWPSWCHCHLYHLLLHLNLDWFYLSGTGLPRLSWKRSL